ncbi:MAG: hypothetical protein AAF583_01685 [Pseudomonadota bacterium]
MSVALLALRNRSVQIGLLILIALGVLKTRDRVRDVRAREQGREKLRVEIIQQNAERREKMNEAENRITAALNRGQLRELTRDDPNNEFRKRRTQ